jgi:hypothetical protein
MDKALKIKIIVFLGILAVCTVFLSIGLSGLTFEPGMALPEINYEQQDSVQPEGSIDNYLGMDNLLKYILIFGITAVIIVLTIYKIIAKKTWKELGSALKLSFILIIVFTVLILFLFFAFPRTTNLTITENLIIEEEERIEAPVGEIPAAIFLILGIIPVVLTVVLVLKIILSRDRDDGARKSLEYEALNAKAALTGGSDLKSVIIKCYHNMCLALKEEHEIERNTFMTTREFEKRLEAEGAPEKPVRILTGLFESARYGNWQPGQEDEKRALNSLDDIIRFFRETKGNNDNEKK